MAVRLNISQEKYGYRERNSSLYRGIVVHGIFPFCEELLRRNIMKQINKVSALLTVQAEKPISIKRRLQIKTLLSGMSVLALTVIVLLLTIGSASAVTVINSCSFNANTPNEHYVLGSNLTCSGAEHGIIIGAHGVIINGYNETDGKYYWINGGSPTTCDPFNTYSGVYDETGSDHVTIQNLEILHFCNGIYLKETQINEHYTIMNCIIHDIGTGSATQGINFQVVKHSTINGCDIYNVSGTGTGCESGGDGIFMKGMGADYGYARNNTITCNNIHDNVKGGIFIKASPDYNNILYNYCWENGEPGHGATGGIVLRCKQSDLNTIEYNNASNNNGDGIYCRGKSNTFKYNTVTGNSNDGIDIGDTPSGGDGSDYNEVSYNFACGNAWFNITTGGGSGIEGCYQNTGVNNTCNGCNDCQVNENAIYCNFTCQNPVSVYFDFDEDAHYSAASCSCSIADGGQCACCNPGMFNGSDDAKASYEAVCNCQWTVGDDPNDCQAYTVTGHLFESDGTTELTNAAVTMKNLQTQAQWNAIVVDNTYTIRVDPALDISAGNMLRITSNNSSADGWTDHKVHTCDIAAEGFTADVIIDNYILNYYPCYPYYTQQEDNWSGPAVMRACIAHYIEPPSQSVLNTTGIANNDPRHAGLLYVDPRGMEKTMDSYLHPIGHNYAVGAMTEVEDALHRICYWQKLGPGAVPAHEDYSNWMAVRGIRTNKVPSDYSAPYDYDVHGFWVNDPNPSGIGENSYKTATEFTTDYYKPVNDPDVTEWDGKYITVLEPPEHDANINIMPAKPGFADTIVPAFVEKTLDLDKSKYAVSIKSVSDNEMLKIVKAAIEGVTEELIPYDAGFASVFAKTIAGEPLFVAGDKKYYIVPFDLPVKQKMKKNNPVVEIQNFEKDTEVKLVKMIGQDLVTELVQINKINDKRTLVVVLVDAENGSFMEASWVKETVKYLPISDKDALKLVLDNTGPLTTRPVIELVYRESSLYYPDWKITINNDVYVVGQDGTVS